MPIIGGTNYHPLTDLTYTGSNNVDDTTNNAHGLFSDPDDIYYFYVYLDHGDSVDVSAHVRIHQPTTNLNNNTEAIFSINAFGTFLGGTPTGDHGDYNTDLGPTTIVNDGFGYRPNRWFYFEMWATFGAVEFDITFSNIVHLDTQLSHSPYTIPVSTQTSGGGGGWNVGNA